MQLKSIDSYKMIERGIELSSDNVLIRIALVEKNILRIWSTVQDDFHPTETFVLDKNEFPSIPIQIEDRSDYIRLSGGELTVDIYLDPFWIDIRDSSKSSFLSTPAGESLEWNGERAIQRFDLPTGIRVYGLGQGTSHTLDLRDQERRMWQQWDGFRYSGNGGIPFLVTSQGYGILLNSTWASRFAIGKAQPAECSRLAKPEGPWKADEHSGEDHPKRFAILTEGGDMDLFIIHGPDYKRIIKGYSDLTGYAPLLPKWALGWIQSKNRYKTQEQFLEVGREYRRRGIPCDVLIIDWCWFERFGYLEWVRKYWPDPVGMARELKAMGFHIMQAQHPYMHKDSPHFKDFSDKGYLISWDPARVPDRWPPDGIRHAVDFSHPDARKLWWKKIEPLFQQGIDGYWTDMGELETHPPGSSPHFLGSREKVHNIYTTLWNKALYDGQRSSSNKRVFCLPRTIYAGTQRYGAALWSGDIDPSWEVLEDQVVIGQQVCLSGQPYWASDIGGFQTTNFYDPELYIRWLQWGAFCPIFRTHGTRPENEPWSFGPRAEKIAVDYIRIRYRLMPYIYSLVYNTSQTGLSMMRSMMIEFPGDEEAKSRNHQFKFGPYFLIAPVTKKGMRKRNVWLPEGIWYSYWDDKRYAGPLDIDEPTPLWKIPIFIRGGSIIPNGPEVLHTGMDLLDPLTLHVYPGENTHFTLYEDDGYTYEYEKGASVLTNIIYHENSKKVEISAAKGSYPGFPAERSLKVIYHDFDCPAKIKANGIDLDPSSWQYERYSRKLEVELYKRSTSRDIILEMEGKDAKKGDTQPETKPALFSWYDLEHIDSPFGYILRIYLDNRAGETKIRGKTLIRMPVGWSFKDLDGENFSIPRGELRIFRFMLVAQGNTFTAKSMATAVVTSSQGEEAKDIQLGSGWASWWKIAGPYKIDGPEGFNKVYAPEKDCNIIENHLESNIKMIFSKGFECFGYVNLEKVFKKMDITEMVATVPECKLCYATCIARSPEKRDCYLQLMGEDRFKVWINDKLVAIVDECIAKPVEYLVRLQKGKNRILIKCTQDAHREWNDRSWGFHFRFADNERKPWNDITYSIG
jgi:alpha-glucosidase (family GH31 glycosyl hydrolase)